jgi:hypothetical protein
LQASNCKNYWKTREMRVSVWLPEGISFLFSDSRGGHLYLSVIIELLFAEFEKFPPFSGPVLEELDACQVFLN